MVGAGLLARNAVARGLTVGPTVKTSLAPGSKAVTGYLAAAGLMEPLEKLGFALAGYGCTTCIGNSGRSTSRSPRRSRSNDLVVAAVLSGNRNFEGRIHPLARASYLASPPLVVAFALAGRVDIDLTTEPLGVGSRRRAGVPRGHLAEPRTRSREVIGSSIDPELFRADLRVGLRRRRALARPADPDRATATPGTRTRRTSRSRRSSTACGGARAGAPTSRARACSRCWATPSRPTTSRPAGSIAAVGPAGTWLQEHGVAPLEFNSYGARRGHHEVMMRGTFGNIRLRNPLVEGKEGPYTIHLPAGEEVFIYDAAMRYRDEGVPLVDPRRTRVRLRLVARLGGEGHRRCSASAR